MVRSGAKGQVGSSCHAEFGAFSAVGGAGEILRFAHQFPGRYIVARKDRIPGSLDSKSLTRIHTVTTWKCNDRFDCAARTRENVVDAPLQPQVVESVTACYHRGLTRPSCRTCVQDARLQHRVPSPILPRYISLALTGFLVI